jgi:hypothetical protein
MIPSFWKKTDKNNNLLGILIKQDGIFMTCVEINETYTDEFILQEISYSEFIDITKDTNCLKLEETPIPSSSSR